MNSSEAGCEDKRLEIDLEGLRENLWRYEDGSPKDRTSHAQHDKPRWIDTSTMICDSLTKPGNASFADRLTTTMATGLLDLRATAESQLKKMAAQKGRKKKAELKNMIHSDNEGKA